MMHVSLYGYHNIIEWSWIVALIIVTQLALYPLSQNSLWWNPTSITKTAIIWARLMSFKDGAATKEEWHLLF